MMQLLCNGVRLDLYDGDGLQFSKKNPMFAFDELSAERTMSFKLPSTPTNDKVLSIARVPAYNGEGMRRKFEAYLQSGVVVKRGFLYVSKFDGKDYEAIMVLDMLYNVKAFGNYELGTLILPYRMATTFIDADDTSPLVGLVKYHHTSPLSSYVYMRPSVDLGQLFTELNSQGVLKMSGMTSDIVRLIRKSGDTYKLDNVLEHLINSQASQGDMGLSTAQGIISTDQMTVYDDRVDGVGTLLTTTAFSIVNGGTISITFPDNTPEDLCLCYPIYMSGDDYAHIGFIGSRSFSRPATQGGDVVYSGDPLAGQTVTFSVDNNKFMLMTGEGMPYSSSTVMDFYEMDYTYQADYDLSIRISQDDIYFGLSDTLPYSAVLMDLSLGDLLKMYSSVVGKLVGATKDGTIKFIDSLSPNFVEPEVMELKEVSRTFSDWAKENIIKFKESSMVLEEERLTMQYDIDNDNIESTKTLQELNAVEGGIYDDGTDNLVLVRVEEKSPYKTPLDVLTEADGYTYLNRPTLRKCSLMQTICESSTMVKAAFHMTLHEYSNIDSETGFLINGVKYTWLEASWQKDVAQVTLVRI